MNVESAIISYLNGQGFTASANVHKGATPPFVTVERTGSSRRSDDVDVVTLAIQCWAKSRAAAVTLVESVDQALIDAGSGISGISSLTRQNYYHFRDPDSELARYQLVYEVTTHR